MLQLLLEPDTLRHISEEAETALAPRRDQGGTERSGGFPGGAVVKTPLASAGDARDMGSIPGSGRFHGVGNGNPLQYSSLEHPMDRGAWRDVVHRAAKGQTQLSERRV